VPFALDTDDVSTTSWAGSSTSWTQSLRFNGSLFFVDIERLQTTIFDPSITNLFFSDNAANAEVTGLEGTVDWAPASVPGLTVTGSFSIPGHGNHGGAHADGRRAQGRQPGLCAGVPGHASRPLHLGPGQRHARPRHAAPAYSDESFSDIITINRQVMDSWVMLGFTAGVSNSQWTAELLRGQPHGRGGGAVDELRQRPRPGHPGAAPDRRRPLHLQL
jgi:iron complex outermembrane receptor protein